MLEVICCFYVYSILNPWIDFYVIISGAESTFKVRKIIKTAYDEWFETDNDIPISDYIAANLKQQNINCKIFWNKTEEEE